jgi:hypothetical protein
LVKRGDRAVEDIPLSRRQVDVPEAFRQAVRDTFLRRSTERAQSAVMTLRAAGYPAERGGTAKSERTQPAAMTLRASLAKPSWVNPRCKVRSTIRVTTDIADSESSTW